MAYMDYLNNIPQQLISAMTLSWDNAGNIAAWLIACTLGYLLYTHALRLMRKEGTDPYPIYLHCWMITIDLIGTYTFWHLALKNDFFWMFVVQGVFLPVWVVLEAICIYKAVKDKVSRQLEFGSMSKGHIDENTAWFNVIGITLVCFAVNMYVLSMIGGVDNAAIWIIYPFTNYVFAYWTWKYWGARAAETGTRKFNSMGLQIIIVIECAVMWIPGISWFLAVTPFFNQAWYYFCGVITTGLAIYNLYKCSQLPKKELLPNGSKPVW